MRCLAALVLFLLQQQQPKPAQEAPKPESITWARSWEAAKRESTCRNVPIMILVSADAG